MVPTMTKEPINTPQDTASEAEKGERIAKALARAGIGSRRSVETMIEARRIRIDGELLDSPAFLVTSLEGITVDGQPVTGGEETRLWRLHKRRGTLTTTSDPQGRPTVFDKLPRHMGRVLTVGRLDMNTEGLLLFTNDGEFARWLELPETELPRTYRVRVYGTVDTKRLAGLKDGATIDGVHYGPIEAVAEEQTSANTWLTVTIYEGKNREVRRLMEHLDLKVMRLIRSHYGPFALGNLALDDVVRVPQATLFKSCKGYFDAAGSSVGSVEANKQTRKGWAKAKAKPNTKPNAKARKRPRREDSESGGNERRNASKTGRSGKPNTSKTTADKRSSDTRVKSRPSTTSKALKGAGQKGAARPSLTRRRPQ